MSSHSHPVTFDGPCMLQTLRFWVSNYKLAFPCWFGPPKPEYTRAPGSIFSVRLGRRCIHAATAHRPHSLRGPPPLPVRAFVFLLFSSSKRGHRVPGNQRHERDAGHQDADDEAQDSVPTRDCQRGGDGAGCTVPRGLLMFFFVGTPFCDRDKAF